MKRRRRRGLSWKAGACALFGAWLAPSPARAEADLFGATLQAAAEAILELNFHSQLQAGLFAVAANDFRPGGAGLRVSGNGAGYGISVGGQMERYAGGAGALGLADFELRPLPLLKKNLYRVVDPFVTAGLELGGGDRGFRASQTFGAGVDLGLFSHPESNRENIHPVISIRYVFRLWQFPDDLPQHLIMIGAATRLVF